MFAFLAMAGDREALLDLASLDRKAANHNLKIGVLAGCVLSALSSFCSFTEKKTRKSVRASKSTNTFHNFHT